MSLPAVMRLAKWPVCATRRFLQQPCERVAARYEAQRYAATPVEGADGENVDPPRSTSRFSVNVADYVDVNVNAHDNVGASWSLTSSLTSPPSATTMAKGTLDVDLGDQRLRLHLRYLPAFCLRICALLLSVK